MLKLKNKGGMLIIEQNEHDIDMKIQELLEESNNSLLELYIHYSTGLLYLRTEKLMGRKEFLRLNSMLFASHIFIDEDVCSYVCELQWEPCALTDDKLKNDCIEMIKDGIDILNRDDITKKDEWISNLDVNQFLSIYSLGL